MTTARLSELPADAPLEEIQDAILDRLHAGEDVDRRAVVRHHGPHAEALGRFFELLDLIETPAGAGRPRGLGHRASQPLGRLGDFQIEGEIGRGGMGVVYAARQLSLNRRVALKVLPHEVRDDTQRLARFQREAEAAGRLRHPNIVPVYAIGDASTAPFFAMELVEGRSLADILRARRAGDAAGLPADGPDWHRWCLEVGRLIAEALAHAHGQGILHRDIKPGNILIDRDGAPRLTDFGLALDLDTTSLTMSGEVFGSPRYMSPEQARMREHPVDARTDVYSLAVTLYELLTDRLPYDGNTSADILASLSNGRIMPPREADPSLSPDVERILMHALQNDPERRYASAGELAADLGAVLDGARPARAPRRWKCAVRRATRSTTRKLVLFIAAVILLVMLFFGLVAVAGLLFLGMPAGDLVVSGDELAAVADGTHGAPGAVLGAWLDVRFHTRSVVSRSEPGQAHFTVTGFVPDDVPDDLVLLIEPQVSVDGGDWLGLPTPVRSDWLAPGIGQTFQSSVPWSTLLGDEFSKDVVRITPRVEVHMARLSPTGVPEPPEPLPPGVLSPGGGWIWTGATRTLALYQQYPSDYPAAVSGPEFDAAMAAAVHPEALVHMGLRSFAPGRRTLEMLLRFEHSRQGPLPAAYEVELWTPDGDAPLGRSTYTSEALPTDAELPAEIRGTNTMLFELPDEPGPDEQRLLLDLESGRVDTLRLRFIPSRDVALEQPLFDRYWDVPVDLEVPVEPWPGPRR